MTTTTTTCEITDCHELHCASDYGCEVHVARVGLCPTCTNTIHEAQLYWDDQDPKASGWWLRYRDAEGDEQGEPIDGDEDTDTPELAEQVALALAGETGTIELIRNPSRRGSIEVVNGMVVNWNA
jgi:hypothetical protein